MRTRKIIMLTLSVFITLSLLTTMIAATPSPVSVSEIWELKTELTAEESYAVSITNNPGTTFVLSHDFTSDVCDIWNEIDSDGMGSWRLTSPSASISMTPLTFIITGWTANIRMKRIIRLPPTSTTVRPSLLKQEYGLMMTMI